VDALIVLLIITVKAIIYLYFQKHFKKRILLKILWNASILLCGHVNYVP
jgi:hypothetical protein